MLYALLHILYTYALLDIFHYTETTLMTLWLVYNRLVYEYLTTIKFIYIFQLSCMWAASIMCYIGSIKGVPSENDY